MLNKSVSHFNLVSGRFVKGAAELFQRALQTLLTSVINRILCDI